MVITHCTMITGRPSRPVNSVTTCPMAESSEIMYKNSVTRVMKLRYSIVTVPYLCLVHSVKTKPSGHLRRMMGPRAPKMSIGSADASA